MKKFLISSSVALMFSLPVFAEENLKTMGDLSDEQMVELNTLFTDYNKCMMQTRLKASQNSQQAQQNADDILQNCETHLESVKTLMIDNGISEGLAMGATKNMRSRAARQLMARSMNNMAAQAAAMENSQ